MIGLCMIVKNESHIVLEALESTLPIIDTYCIVDTGSTDDTIKVIRDFYASKKIEGQVHQRPWVDFGFNRSEALSLCDGHMDYIVMIDADDVMVCPDGAKEKLTNMLRSKPNSANVNVCIGNLNFFRPQVFKANDGWRYEGVLHEYATNDRVNVSINLSGFCINARTVGFRSKSSDKYVNDALVLEQALVKDPSNQRYVFYLAQSYKDAGNLEKAVENYKKRYDMGGWIEERYISGLNISRLLKSKEWAWKAHEVCPWRSECLVSYMSYCRSKDMWSQELFAMASYASTIKKPNDALFLEADSYWRVWDELSIIAYYTGHKDVAFEASRHLFQILDCVPKEEHERLKANAACINK